jgi:hypothetical protein
MRRVAPICASHGSVVVASDDIPAAAVSPRVIKPTSVTRAGILVVVAVIAGSLYANLSYLVTDRAHFRFFPPFVRGLNRNDNDHLAAEYYSIAGALAAGRGFADPFREPTGPTAWMPPIFVWLLAGLRWVANDNTQIVIAMLVVLQDLTLITTGLLILALARQSTGAVGIAAVLFAAALCYSFRLCFQFTHDCWIVLLALDLLVAGMVWLRPFESSCGKAALWGIGGGVFALVSPVIGFAWGVLAITTGWRQGRRMRLAVAVAMSIATIAPWVLRNYLALGRLIPIKSNLAFELYQSQCVASDGILHAQVFRTHPYNVDGEERAEYRTLGEMGYVDRKWELFREAVQANPLDFTERVANRFFAATLEYVPYHVREQSHRPGMFWLSQAVYPLPFLSLLVLLFATPWQPLTSCQWIVIGTYTSYLLPYVVVSYYDRYKYPMMLAEILMMVWAAGRLRGGWLRVTGRVDAAESALKPRLAMAPTSAGS